MNLNECKIFARKIFKLGLSWLLFYSGLLSLYRKTKQSTGVETEILILRYHRIFDDNDRENFYKLGVNKTNFDKQIRYLKQNYHLLSLDKAVELLKKKEAIPPGAVAITFDDGYRDNWLYAYPVLAKYEVPATIYLTTQYIDTAHLLSWDRLRYMVAYSKLTQVDIAEPTQRTFDLSSPRRKKESFYQIKSALKKVEEDVKNKIIDELESQLIETYPDGAKRDLLLSWEEVKQMSDGKISFGGHTRTHPLLTNLSVQEATSQIRESKQAIENRIDRRVVTFAYPGGVFNEKIKNIVKENGYEAACSTFLGANNHNSDLFALKRKGVTDGSSTGISGKFSKPLFAVEMSGFFDKLFSRT